MTDAGALARIGPGEQFDIAGLSAWRYVRSEDPVTFVLCHGAMDRASGFRRAIRHLSVGTVLVYDRRGYGGSRGLPVSNEVDTHVEDLSAVIDSAGTPVVLLGHSQGGLISLTLLAGMGSGSAVVGAGVWEAPLPWLPWYRTASDALVEAPDPEAAAEAFLVRVIGEKLWARVPAAQKQDRLAEGEALLADIMSGRQPGFSVDLEAIDLPVVFGAGELSDPFHLRAAEVAAQRVSNASLHRFSDVGHGVHLRAPRVFAEFAALALAAVQG